MDFNRREQFRVAVFSKMPSVFASLPSSPTVMRERHNSRVARSVFVLDVFPQHLTARLINPEMWRPPHQEQSNQPPPCSDDFIQGKGPQYFIETHVVRARV